VSPGSLASQCHLPSRGCGWCWPPARNLPCSTSGVAARRQTGAEWCSEQQAGMRMPCMPFAARVMACHAMSCHASGWRHSAMLMHPVQQNKACLSSVQRRCIAWQETGAAEPTPDSSSVRACSQSGPMPETQMAARRCHPRTSGRAETVFPTAPQSCSQCTCRDDVCASFGNMPCHAMP